MFDVLIEQWQAQSKLEVIAFVLSVAYVLLAARQNILCWVCGLVSTSIYAYLFYSVNLKFHSLLNLYYIIMAFVGFFSWYNKEDDKPFVAKQLSFKHHIIILSIGLVISLVLIGFAQRWFNSEQVVLDAVITVFSVCATMMTARKYIDNWYYWLVLNIAAAYMFIETGLYLTALLMVIYTFVAIYGLFKWRKSLRGGIVT